MSLWPPLQVKPLFKTETGELIQLPKRSTQPALAIVIDTHLELKESGKILLCLTPLFEESAAPACYLFPNNCDSVLSFGKDYIFVTDPLGSSEESGQKGFLYVGPSTTLLKCASFLQNQYIGGITHYDVNEKTTTQIDSQQKFLAFKKWEIRLRNNQDFDIAAKTIYKFPLDEAEGKP